MRIFFLCAAIMLCAVVAVGWQYSASTSWNGSQHVAATTSFTPGSTTAYLSECSPVWTGTPSCPSGGMDYVANAFLYDADFTPTYEATKQCGGNTYSGAVTVTTDPTWTVKASITQSSGTQQSAQGPVTAVAANPQYNCPGS